MTPLYLFFSVIFAVFVVIPQLCLYYDLYDYIKRTLSVKKYGWIDSDEQLFDWLFSRLNKTTLVLICIPPIGAFIYLFTTMSYLVVLGVALPIIIVGWVFYASWTVLKYIFSFVKGSVKLEIFDNISKHWKDL